ncbi:MAG: sulfotransferase [Rhodospirillales bacterium]
MTIFLNSEQMLRAAEKETGLRDWGGDPYFESSFMALFTAMAWSLDQEAALTERGRNGAAVRLAAMAEMRLRFIDDRKSTTAICSEPIEAPVFILGLPRAGSSFLQALMSRDPANRSTRSWEMYLPSPPPTRATYAADPRIARAERIMRAMGLCERDILQLHPFDAREPEEDHWLMELMALGENLQALWRLPHYMKVRAEINLREGYLTHRMVLQNLQHRCRGERWVLKNPGHIFYLEHLLAVYPDARIIQTHRDPAAVIPSVTALLLAMRHAASEVIYSGEKIAKNNLRTFAAGLNAAIAFRARPDMDSHFHDVHFRNLIADPIGTVRKIYAQFGMPLSQKAEDSMHDWLARDNSHAAKGKFRLEQFGLNDSQIDNAFGDYMSYYGIAREHA